MAKSKKILYIFTLCVVIVLIVCTALSKYISDAITPVVEVVKPVEMELEVDGAELKVYDKVVPCSAIIPGAYNSKYVYIVRERKGLFGQEYYTALLEVQVVAFNDIYAAIGGWNVTAFDDVIISPSGLSSGDVVKVVGRLNK